MDGHQKQREQSAIMMENALFTLLEEKEFAAISVSEIASRADWPEERFIDCIKKRKIFCINILCVFAGSIERHAQFWKSTIFLRSPGNTSDFGTAIGSVCCCYIKEDWPIFFSVKSVALPGR